MVSDDAGHPNAAWLLRMMPTVGLMVVIALRITDMTGKDELDGLCGPMDNCMCLGISTH
jgi:hypothetical protein